MVIAYALLIRAWIMTITKWLWLCLEPALFLFSHRTSGFPPICHQKQIHSFQILCYVLYIVPLYAYLILSLYCALFPAKFLIFPKSFAILSISLNVRKLLLSPPPPKKKVTLFMVLDANINQHYSHYFCRCCNMRLGITSHRACLGLR